MDQIINNRTDCIYVLAYTSTVTYKYLSLSPFALKMDFHLQIYASDKGKLPPKKCATKNSIYIATIEKASALINSLIALGRLGEIGIIAIDEIGKIGVHKRGSHLEELITKVKFVNGTALKYVIDCS